MATSAFSFFSPWVGVLIINVFQIVVIIALAYLYVLAVRCMKTYLARHQDQDKLVS